MKRNIALLSIGGGILIIAGLSFVAWFWTRQSAVGTVSIGTYTANPTRGSNATTVSAPYFTAKLPAGFVINRQAEKPTPIVQFSLTASTNSSIDEQVSISIGALPAGGIQENGDYILRLTKPNIYQQVGIPSLPTEAIAFRAISASPELTIFWPHRTNYAEISCSSGGGATSSQIETVCKNLVATWTWVAASR